MTEELLKTDISRIISFDIETVPENPDFNENSKEYKNFQWKMRDRDTLEVPTDPEIVKEYYYRNAGLWGEYCKIVCLSVTVYSEKRGCLVSKSFTGDEKEIIVSFVNMVKQYGYKMLGHNIIKFDLPVLRKRWKKHRLPTSQYFTLKEGNDSMNKPWVLENSVLDTMAMWQGCYYTPPSLDDICYALDLPSPKENISGSEVFKYYSEGKIDDIAEYCEGDTVAVFNVFLNLIDREPLPVVRATELQLTKDDVLKRLNNTNILDENIKSELISLLKGNVDESNKEYVINLILSAYLKPKERVAEVKSKTLEVQELVNGL